MWDSYPLGGNEWMLDYYVKIGSTLSDYAKEKLGRPIHLSHGYPFMGTALKAYPVVWEYGAMGPAGEAFNGGCGGRGECDLEAAAEWHHEHDAGTLISRTLMRPHRTAHRYVTKSPLCWHPLQGFVEL